MEGVGGVHNKDDEDDDEKKTKTKRRNVKKDVNSSKPNLLHNTEKQRSFGNGEGDYLA